MNYDRELKDVNDLIAAEKYKQAVTTACAAVEQLLKDLYTEIEPKLTQTERLKAQSAITMKQRDPKKLTFGQWVGVFGESNLYRLIAERLNYRLRFLNAGTLSTIVGIRNDCTHEDYKPSLTDAQTVRQFLAQYLLETNRGTAEVAAAVLPPAAKEERAKGALPAWTQIATPNRDIRDRRFELGIFAIHLGEIAIGKGTGQPEYADPETFFDLTYITRGLRSQLVQMMSRLSGLGSGASVVQLDTTFGGGKTHTLLAMYHLAKHGYSLKERDDVRALTNEARVEQPPQAAVAVLDGSYLAPSSARTTPEGVTLRTLWGEVAYQLGGVSAYEILRASDESMSAPGSDKITQMLRSLNRPALILIDELLDYATKAAAIKVGRGYLIEQVQSFIKALTQAVDPLPSAMVVLTLTSSPQQIFGESARRLHEELTAQAYGTFKTILERVQRTEVTAESAEIYEILRRRLFEQVGTLDDHKRIADAYWKYYREHARDFPQDVTDPKYRDRIEQAYPFHPDLIDVLRDRWGTIQGFQKTRGVLRLLALVVSNLYRKNHGAPLIHVGHIDLAEPEVRRELLGHVDSPGGYESAIGSDIAGLDGSKAEQLDQQIGGDYYRFGVCEGLATTLFMYSHTGAAGFAGGTKPQLWLGVLQPDIKPAIAGDAFGKLENTLWYMEREGALARVGVEPNLNMMLVYRMDALRQDTDKLNDLIFRTLESITGTVFGKPIIFPEDSRLIRDNNVLKLVIAPRIVDLRQDLNEAAKVYLDEMLKFNGDKHRQFRNTVIFLFPTPEGAANITQAAVKLMALEDIQASHGQNLKEHVSDELRSQLAAARVGLPAAVWGAYIITVTAGKDEEYWFTSETGISTYRDGSMLSQRVVDRLKDGERLLERFHPDYLVRGSDPRFAYLWQADQDAVKTQDLWDAFARYTFLPMLFSQRVLQDAIAEGVQRGLFGYATGSAAKPDKIYFDERISADQVALSEFAWLINAERARPLRYPPPPEPVYTPSIETPADPVESDDESASLAIDGDTLPRGVLRYEGVNIEIDLNPLEWRTFYNSVIQPLVARGANVNLRISLNATHEEGMDLDFIELSIKESVVQISRTARVSVTPKH